MPPVCLKWCPEIEIHPRLFCSVLFAIAAVKISNYAVEIFALTFGHFQEDLDK